MQKFKDLPYERPDVNHVMQELRGCIDKFANAADFEQAHAAFLERAQVMSRVETMYTIAYIRNTVNMKDEFYDGEIAFFNEAIPQLTPVEQQWLGEIVKSPYRAELEKLYGKKLT